MALEQESSGCIVPLNGEVVNSKVVVDSAAEVELDVLSPHDSKHRTKHCACPSRSMERRIARSIASSSHVTEPLLRLVEYVCGIDDTPGVVLMAGIVVDALPLPSPPIVVVSVILDIRTETTSISVVSLYATGNVLNVETSVAMRSVPIVIEVGTSDTILSTHKLHPSVSSDAG